MPYRCTTAVATYSVRFRQEKTIDYAAGGGGTHGCLQTATVIFDNGVIDDIHRSARQAAGRATIIAISTIPSSILDRCPAAAA